MYSFEPSEEQKMLIDVVKRYAENDLRPAAHEAEEEGKLPQALIEKGWELGILQASIPEEYGGFGEYSVITDVLATEELAWGDMAGAIAVMLPGLFMIPVMMVGSKEQKETYLSSIVEAEWTPYTAALLEGVMDFDPTDLQTMATENGDEYILQGEKRMVPFAADAKAMLVYANLDGKTQGFIVPEDTAGVSVGEREKLLGLNALPNYSVRFDDVRIPKENRLGGPGGHDFAPIIDSARLAMAAIAVGMARGALEYSVDYAKERTVFGVKVAQKQAIAFMIAEMDAELEAARLLTWEAAWRLDNEKEEASKAAYLALMSAVDMAMMVTDRSVQILGGYGYIREYPVELWYRNGRGIAMLTGLAMV
jgi:alkylation response protein AidB-like acyl-CoA dehydrogenase